MKLLLYSHFFAPGVGGVETLLLSLARGLAGLRGPSGESQFEVTLVTQTAGREFDDGALGFRVVRQPDFWELRRWTRWTDVVHLAGPALAPMVLGFLEGKPVVIEHHGYQAVCPNGLLFRQPTESVCAGHFLAAEYGKCLRCLRAEGPIVQSWSRLLLMFPRYWLAKRASANIAISNHFVGRCALPRLSVIYHGVEEPLESFTQETDAPQKPIRFAYIGRLVREKGLIFLVEAARLLGEEGHAVELLLIGDGPERPVLESAIARQGLRDHVRITGFLTGSAFAEAANGADAVLMPTVCEETAGLAAMEQMMRGRLVIASDIGGLGEVVGDAGLKVKPGDPRALADAMRAVVQNPLLVTSLGEKARARAHLLFRRDRMIAEHAQLYRRLASGRR